MSGGERSGRSDHSGRLAFLKRKWREAEKERRESEKERREMKKERREMKKERREMKKETKEIKKEQKCTSQELKELQGLFEHWSGVELTIVAGEIWKWSVRKMGAAGGDGRHLYDLDPLIQADVKSAAKAMRMVGRTADMKAMSRTCILANDTLHFQTIEALDAAVLNCQSALNIFPSLRICFPLQYRTLKKYEQLKLYLPHNFC